MHALNSNLYGVVIIGKIITKTKSVNLTSILDAIVKH